MRYAILSDVHANLEALEAVLADAEPRVDTMVCLGDIVGYNADPHTCIQLIREKCSVVIAGNHDQAASGLRPYDDFSEYAKEAMDWTREQLTLDEIAYLRGLPALAAFGKGALAAHGSPRDTDEYLFHQLQFEESFLHLQAYLANVQCCFVGHTHLPMIWQYTPEGLVSPPEVEALVIPLQKEHRYIVNPGSVGQPRYGDPAASYVILDEGNRTIEFRFIEYDFLTTQEKIYDAMLPALLAERLAVGQ